MLGPFDNTTVVTKEANLTGLIKDESYNVSVLATTVKGDGPYSVPIILPTNENSKYFETFIRNLKKKKKYRRRFVFCDNGNYLKKQLLRHPLDRQL